MRACRRGKNPTHLHRRRCSAAAAAMGWSSETAEFIKFIAIIGGVRFTRHSRRRILFCGRRQNWAVTPNCGYCSEGRAMTTETTLLVEERLRRLFQHLGIDRAHVVGRSPNDWRGLATTFPEMVASLTLLGPMTVDPQNIAHLASRLLVITGDQGPTAENVRAAMARLEKSSVVILPGYSLLGWSDLVADCPDEISSALLQFLGQVAS